MFGLQRFQYIQCATYRLFPLSSVILLVQILSIELKKPTMMLLIFKDVFCIGKGVVFILSVAFCFLVCVFLLHFYIFIILKTLNYADNLRIF